MPTVFSNMSDPDILLTIEAYTRLKVQLKQGQDLEVVGTKIKHLIPVEKRIERLELLINSLLDEWVKRGNE